MKISPKKQSLNGFTLVELLVVIAIIATLTAISVPAVSKAVENGKLTKSKAHAKALENAIVGYHSDNSVYPDAKFTGFMDAMVGINKNSEDRGMITNVGANTEIIKALLGEEDTPVINVRNIQYLSGLDAKASGNEGIDYTDYTFLDWNGRPYHIVWDANYDGILDAPLATGEDLRRGVIVAGQGKSDDPLTSMSRPNEIAKTWD